MKRTSEFPAEPRSVGAARRFATTTLEGTTPAVLESVELMVSELATNSVRHARTGFRLMIRYSEGVILVEVTDRACGTPAMRSPGPEDPTGRGLLIVDMLSDEWGVDYRAARGKTVWFKVAGRGPARREWSERTG
jgi:anti-sigma regulatory factor (Ser/Thr protein kinase)